jgi:hypothetical protein
MIKDIDRMNQVYCPLRNECKVVVCHHKSVHEFNKDTCSIESKLKSGCNPAASCIHVSNLFVPCDNCIKFECAYRGRVETVFKDSRDVEYHYNHCDYATMDTLKRRPITYEDQPRCFGLLWSTTNSDCQNCLVYIKCQLKNMDYIDKGLLS